jgi:hypothetical protein
MKTSLCFCVVVLIAGWNVLQAHADLISVDFQAASSGGPANSEAPATMSGAEANFGLGNIWNAVNLPTLAIDSPGPLGEQSFFDSNGNPTSVKLNLTGDVIGYNRLEAPEVSALIRDYLIYHAADASNTLGFELSGLQPGESYNLIMYAANPNFSAHNFTTTVDMNGDGSLDGETPQNVTPNGLMFASITASLDGKILASLTDTNEGNIAGFQLEGNFVPEPASASLACLAAAVVGCLVWRKRLHADRN